MISSFGDFSSKFQSISDERNRSCPEGSGSLRWAQMLLAACACIIKVQLTSENKFKNYLYCTVLTLLDRNKIVETKGFKFNNIQTRSWEMLQSFQYPKFLNKLIIKQGQWLHHCFCQSSDFSHLNLIWWASLLVT